MEPKTAKQAISRGNYRKARAKRWTCSFVYSDRRGCKIFGLGRTFDVAGAKHDLFPSGVLCGMLGYSLDTIRSWEKTRGWPPALWHLADDERKKRWYSRKQLIAIRTIAETFNYVRGKDRNKLDQFIAAVRRVFFTIDMPTEPRDNEREAEGTSLQSGESAMAPTTDGCTKVGS